MFISKTSKTQLDTAENLHIVMSVYQLIKFSDNYSKPFSSLWQYYRDEPALNNVICEFLILLNVMAPQTVNNGTGDVERTVSLKYVSNFCKALKYL